MEDNFENNKENLNPNQDDSSSENDLTRYQSSEVSEELPPRVLIDGHPDYVQAAIDELEEIGFAKASDWSSPLPSEKEGEVVRILFNPKCASEQQ